MSYSSGTTLISPTNTIATTAMPGTGTAVGAGGAGGAGSGSGAASGNGNGAPRSPSVTGSTSTGGTERRKHTRIGSHHAHTHGHGHAHGHTHGHGHTAHHSSHAHVPRRVASNHSHSAHRPVRRGSDGESGRRAVAAGLAMHVLDAAAPTGKGKRTASEPHVHTAHTSHTHAARPRQTSLDTHTTAHNTSAAAGANHTGLVHADPKASRSDTHLPHLGRTPSSSTLSSGSSAARKPRAKDKDKHHRKASRDRGAERHRKASRDRDADHHRKASRDRDADHHRKSSRDRDAEIVEVIKTGDSPGDDNDGGDDDDWVSGDETPDVRSAAASVARAARNRTGEDEATPRNQPPAKMASVNTVNTANTTNTAYTTSTDASRSTAPATASTAYTSDSTAPTAKTAPMSESPLELRPRSPNHEPPATQRTTGFPGTEPSAAAAETSSEPTSAPQSKQSKPAPQPESAPASPPSSQPGSRRASILSASRPPKPSSASATETPRDAATAPQGFPFPNMPEEAESPAATTTEASAGPSAQSPKSPLAPSPAAVTAAPSSAPAAPTAPAGRSRVVSIPPPLKRDRSHASLRSLASLRAPHPLNSPAGAWNGLDSPRQSRVASLHYPPAAPAIVYRETVEGQGWDGASQTSPTGAEQVAESPTEERRPSRVGSFSSVKSLKDRFVGTSSRTAPPPSPRRTSYGPTPARQQAQVGSGHPNRPVNAGHVGQAPRRMTAMQAASAVARLGTTNDPVAYHQSLGFSPATAETAHLLSRFLPPKRSRRPRWAITAREALAAHAAMEAGELDAARIGLTDGQYRDAHESLVATLRELGNAKRTRRAARSYTYQALLGQVDEETTVDNKAAPRTPFELAADRCLQQRPRPMW